MSEIMLDAIEANLQDDLDVYASQSAREGDLLIRRIAEIKRERLKWVRKTVATLIDDEGLSARIGADQLGHSHVSMTQDRYLSRGRVHTQVADLLDCAVRDDDDTSD